MISKIINGQFVDFYEDGDFNEDGTDYAYNEKNLNIDKYDKNENRSCDITDRDIPDKNI